MNTEKLRFTTGDPPEIQAGDNFWLAQIHVIGDEVWLGRIAVYGLDAEGAEALRERVLWALKYPETADVWQYKSKKGDVWHNCESVVEAVKAKAEGYETRALTVRRQLREV